MRTLLSAMIVASLAGCVGGIETTDPPTQGVGGGGSGPAAGEARKLYEDNVFPVMVSKCAACHSAAGPVSNTTGFVGTDKASSYVAAVGYQAVVGDWTAGGAPILTKIAPGDHNATNYTQPEKDKLTAWLTKELESRAGGGGGPLPPGSETPASATVRLTREWSGCLTLANFQAANMKAWGNMRADGSQCKTCHGLGEYGNFASDTDTPFFNVISTNKYYMAQYFSVDLTGGPAAGKIVINTRSFTGVGEGLVPHAEHPRFDLDGSTGMAALQKLYDATMAAKMAGTCGTPTLTN